MSIVTLFKKKKKEREEDNNKNTKSLRALGVRDLHDELISHGSNVLPFVRSRL
jgi:hypothetical protein